jgi:hypothetical protein
MPRARGKYRAWAAQPAERMPPFLLVSEASSLVLIAPFAKRPRGPTPEETALVRTVARRLVPNLPADRPLWIDPHDGTATPAALGEGQLRRRLIDNASFNVRTAA